MAKLQTTTSRCQNGSLGPRPPGRTLSSVSSNDVRVCLGGKSSTSDTRAHQGLTSFTSTSSRTPPTSPLLRAPAACLLLPIRIRRRFDYLTVPERNQPSAWSHPSIHPSSHPPARTTAQIPQTAIVTGVLLALSRKLQEHPETTQSRNHGPAYPACL